MNPTICNQRKWSKIIMDCNVSKPKANLDKNTGVEALQTHPSVYK